MGWLQDQWDRIMSDSGDEGMFVLAPISGLTPEQLVCDHACSSNLAVDACARHPDAVYVGCGCPVTSHPPNACSRFTGLDGPFDVTQYGVGTLVAEFEYPIQANSSAISDLGSDKALLERANEVARQAWEIADQRAKRIAELETEVAALTDTLKTLFRSAAQAPAIPANAVEFPVNALKWSV